MTRQLKPIIFLDVDGVVNLLNPSQKTISDRNLQKLYVLLDRNGRPDRFVNESAYDAYRKSRRGPHPHYQTNIILCLFIDPSIKGLIDQLKWKFDIAWGTAWEEHANRLIAPSIGLPSNLPYVTFDYYDQTKSPSGVFHKTQKIIDFANGRRFVWFDDDAFRADRQFIDRKLGPGHSKAITVAGSVGLTQDHVDRAIDFLSSPFDD